MKFGLVILALGISLLSFSQKDAETEMFLKAAADKALSYKTMKTNFEFVIENSQEETDNTYKGELWVKGNKFKMIVDNVITISDGKNRWVYMPEVNEVNISVIEKDEDLDPEERFLIEPLSLFTLYKKGFKYGTSGSQLIENKNYTIVDLTPEDISKPYFKIKCWISEELDYYAVKYFQKDGTRITLQLIDFVIDEKLKDSQFLFNPKSYPNVEIIDLRE